MKTRKSQRLARRRRIRSKVKGTALRPRLAVFRSNYSMTVQLIDDERGVTILSTMSRGVNLVKAKELGEGFAKEIVKKGIKTVVYDRGGFRYHGVIKAFADAVRTGGITL